MKRYKRLFDDEGIYIGDSDILNTSTGLVSSNPEIEKKFLDYLTQEKEISSDNQKLTEFYDEYIKHLRLFPKCWDFALVINRANLFEIELLYDF